ncbi:uncharacterized protein ACA1_376430 [Acanthamoeba castellanii str. Neff]|uniref:Uncharacterized protein n=1 Tax=Acanthamoeba castellanii (strain ATCC 30010 / Neff) TaxID=1257118 RepID=L8HGA9_ACACF|nr:uncharacterized protein ACA1_376430 [Acanthamoeba castellanii str. Neff]ELR24170.1 hypothetical protein ACA1_376430 [Acanthamoeba castellanii str. Neff]
MVELAPVPEAQKLNKAEQRKLQENLHNYTSIMKKFLNINSWPKSNKYKISKNAFKELLIACQRHVKFLSKVRKVATHLMDRDFIHLKNKVATGEWVCSPFA